MTDGRPVYRSNQSVPDRVDRAWKLGYDAGVKNGRRLAFGAVAIALFALWRHPAVRRRPELLPWALAATLAVLPLALCLLLLVLVGQVVRAGVRHHRDRAPRFPAVSASVGDPPF